MLHQRHPAENFLRLRTLTSFLRKASAAFRLRALSRLRRRNRAFSTFRRHEYGIVVTANL